MCFNKENVDHFCKVLTTILRELKDTNVSNNAVMKNTTEESKSLDNTHVILHEKHNLVNGQEYVVVHCDKEISVSLAGTSAT